MKRKKTDAPFDLRDPIVPEVRGTSGAASDIVTRAARRRPTAPNSDTI